VLRGEVGDEGLDVGEVEQAEGREVVDPAVRGFDGEGLVGGEVGVGDGGTVVELDVEAGDGVGGPEAEVGGDLVVDEVGGADVELACLCAEGGGEGELGAGAVGGEAARVPGTANSGRERWLALHRAG